MAGENELVLRRPDDWHLHLRDGAMLSAVTPFSSAHFARAIVMPNLVPPVVRADQAAAYRDRIMEAVPAGHDFTPLMTLYLTEDSDPEDIVAGARSGLVQAVKLYPAGATTNSDSGVRDMGRIDHVLARMAEIGLPLLVHGEVTSPEVDIFDREAVFIDTVLDPLRRRHPGLRVVMEHVTTTDAVDYILSADEGLAATITVHHLIINRNAIFAGGLRPHYFCLPIAKREHHRLRLRRAAASGDARFFLGTDSAPHADAAKESTCGCAGVFSTPNALTCLAHVFQDENALGQLESFISLNGPAFYGLQPNEDTIRLVRGDHPVPAPEVTFGSDTLTIFEPGFPVLWRMDRNYTS